MSAGRNTILKLKDVRFTHNLYRSAAATLAQAVMRHIIILIAPDFRCGR